MPAQDDENILARVKRFQFYAVQEDFLDIWKQYELFLTDYEKRMKMKVQSTAKIGNTLTNRISSDIYGFLIVQYRFIQ